VFDIRTRDSRGRWLNIEIQASVVAGLIKRLVYSGCSLYVDQLEAGDGSSDLPPTISIGLLRDVLFRDTDVTHRRFQLADEEHGRTLEATIGGHTVELPKENVNEATLGTASGIEQCVGVRLHADQYDADRSSVAAITGRIERDAGPTLGMSSVARPRRSKRRLIIDQGQTRCANGAIDPERFGHFRLDLASLDVWS